MKTFTRISVFLTMLLLTAWGTSNAQFTCDSPQGINCGDVTYGATAGVANDNASSGAITCGTTVGTGGQMWYVLTAPADGTCTITTEGSSDYDTKLHVYTGSCGAGNLVCVTGDDDSGTGLLSSVTFNLTAGTTYLIRVGGYAANEGSFQLNVTCDLATDGCTDPAACNFSNTAINDDGSCCYGVCETLVVTGGTFPTEVTWTLNDPSGNPVLSGGAPFNGTVCLPSASCGYSFVMNDAFGDGWNGATYTFTDPSGNVDATGTLDAGATATVSIAFGGLTLGCTDPLASNFDPTADCDDASCVTCAPGELALKVLMFDAFGDGWNGATWFVLDANGNTAATGTLATGTFGVTIACLPQGCYTFQVTNGTFPGEVSWELRDLAENPIGSGVAGDTYGFSWAGATGCVIPGCTNTICNNYNPFATQDDGSCICPPDNDECANATPIGCGQSTPGTTINANLDPTAVSCDPNTAITSPGVWYTFIGTGDLVQLSTCNSAGGDTKIHVFSGDCNALVCLTQNDDGCAGGGFLSSISFTAQNGVAYYVLVSEFGAGNGIDFVLDMECVSCSGSPINDQCASALPLPTGVNFPGNLCCANPDTDMQPWAGFGTQYGIWYVINSADFGALAIEFFNGAGQGVDATDGTDVGIGIFEGSAGCGALTPVIGGIGFDSDPADGSTLDGFIFNSYEYGIGLNPNTDYYICVTTSDPINCGDFVLNVSLSNIGCTDATACNYCADCTIDDASCEYISCGAVTPNDLCDNAIALSCNSTVNGSTGNATATGAPTVCPVGAADIGVWYTFTGDGQFVTLSTCGSTVDSRITIVSSANGCAGPFTCVDSEDDDAADTGCGFFNGDDASIGFVSTPGTVYYVYITAGSVDTNGDGVADLTEGPFTLSFNCEPVVQGCQDACACNYDANANVDNGSCDFFSCANCDANSTAVRFDMTDTFGDGWNGNTYSITDLSGAVVAEGDLNTASCGDALNAGFDVFCLPNGCYTMNVGGGAFAAEVAWSMTDATGAVIIAGNAGAGTGTFSFTIGGGLCGCTDTGACNFDPAATSDNGSCEYTSCAGCADATACNFDATATINDPTLCCYDNCVTLIMNDSFGDGWNGATATVVDALTGNIVGTAGLPTGSNGSASFCLATGCYTIIAGGGTFDGEISWTLTGVTGGILNGIANDPDGIGFSVGGANCVPACTEPLACNYDPTAGISDCTLCEYQSCQGCTYAQSSNYNPNATIDDGSCLIEAVSTCPSDINGDGIVGVSDLLIFIADYGTVCFQGPGGGSN